MNDARHENAPPMPFDRPPTRAEVWAHVQHYYSGGDKTEAQLQAMARDRWAGNYVYWVNFNGWKKQPDWTEGDPVIEAGVPTKPFEAGHGRSYYNDVRALLERARERKAA
jgi:hypothetical protein